MARTFGFNTHEIAAISGTNPTHVAESIIDYYDKPNPKKEKEFNDIYEKLINERRLDKTTHKIS